MSNIYWPFDTSCVSEWPGGYSDIRDGVHMGTDFAVSQGTPLLATGAGRIVTYRGSGGYGIDINLDDGRVIRNWHLSRFDVSNGDIVEVGQQIGLTGGATGTPGAGNSTGPHLHWELRTNTNFSQSGWLDPRDMTIYTFGENPDDKKESRNDMATGAFYRANDGEFNGAIFFQEMPNKPLVGIDLPTWNAYSANGNRYADMSTNTIKDIIKKYGSQ